MTITAKFSRAEAKRHQEAVFHALMAAEAANPGSPELKALHGALADMQDFLFEVSKSDDEEAQRLEPLSGGDKPPKPEKP